MYDIEIIIESEISPNDFVRVDRIFYNILCSSSRWISSPEINT